MKKIIGVLLVIIIGVLLYLYIQAPTSIKDSNEIHQAALTHEEREEVMGALFAKEDDVWQLPTTEYLSLLKENGFSQEVVSPWDIDIISSVSFEDSLYIVTKSTNQELTAHVYGAVIGMHVLKKSESGWETLSSEPALSMMGEFGDFGTDSVEVVKLSDTVVGFMFNPSFSGQGYTQKTTIIYGYYKNQFKEFLTVSNTYGDNYGTVDAKQYATSAEFEFMPGDSELYDIVMISTTETSINDKVVPTEISESTYSFKNGTYELI